MADDSVIQTLEARRVAAMLDGDIAALKALLHPSVAWIHSAGARDSRESLLQRIATGELRYMSIESRDVETRHDGDLGTVTGRADIVAELAGTILRSANLYVGIWVRGDDGWQLIQLQSTGLKG